VTGWEFVMERSSELLLRTREHLFLSGVSIGAAVLVGMPLGMAVSRNRWAKSLVFGAAKIVQTVPSLAMLAFLLALTGKIGVLPAIVALTLYAFLPIIQNTVTALEGVSPEMLEASAGMGMTPLEQMRMVKLPLAMPVITAGIKTAAVISVGIATLSAFIGAGGLGEFINRGLSLSDTRLILLGAFPSALLAIYVSFAIASVEWGLNNRKRRRVRLLAGKAGRLLTFVPLLLLLVPGLLGQSPPAGAGKTVRVGSKNFTEQLILAEMMARRIEAATGLNVERSLNLGGTMICHGAIVRGEIDIYPEYTGTALTAILNVKERVTGPESAYRLVSREYRRLFGLRWLGSFGFNNTYAFAVREEDAKKYGWKNVSDLKGRAASLTAGITSEFYERPDGYPGFRRMYGIEFGKVKSLDPALMYEAVKEGQVDVISAFSTDSRIPDYGLVILKDDKSFFPPYYAAPVVREEVIGTFPEIGDALEPLAGMLDERTMQWLNFEVDRKKRPVREVVEEFLGERGLLK
jgi:osmoprotectant transport system permease protein